MNFKLTFSIFTFLFVFFKGFSQVDFSSENVIYDEIMNSPNGVRDLFPVDMNGDGNLDILVGDGKKVYWYENDAEGTFSNSASNVIDIYTNSDNRFDSVFAADLDNDGDMDVITAREFRDDVMWYENLGNETFSAPNIISNTLNGPISVIAVDVDNDLLKDIVVGTTHDENVVWFKNNGNGTFQLAQLISQDTDEISEMIAKDIDGDGIDDLIVGMEDAAVKWIKNNGDGTFGLETIVVGQGNSGKALAVKDLDDDGDYDIITESNFADTIGYYANDGNGNFSDENVIDTPISAPSELKVGDFDEDGLLDVIVVISNNTIIFYKNNGDSNMDGILEFNSGVSIVQEEFIGSDLVIGDFNMNGKTDIIHPSILSIEQQQNQGDLIFSKKTIGFYVVGIFKIVPVDSNGDGFQDLLISTNERVSLLKNDGTGNFGNLITLFHAPLGISQKPDISIGDFNNDGNEDFVTTLNNSVTVFFNDGAGIFTQNQVVINGNVFDVVVSDYDQDGDEDLAFNVRLNSNTYGIYKAVNDGSGFFLNSVLVENLQDSFALLLADIDDDGDDDIISNKMGYFQNDGLGNFGPYQSIPTGVPDLEDFYIVDLDNDNLSDVLIGDFVNDFFGYSASNGDGTYTWVFIDNVTNLNSVAHGDLDNDGDQDIIIGASINESIFESSNSYYLNNGDGTFQPRQGLEAISPASNQQSHSVVDINNDGKLDILSGQKSIGLYMNNSNITNSTFIPDDNFEQALIDLGLDSTLDNLVLTANIETITNIDLSGKNIVNTTGIEDFIALQILDLSQNDIEVINLNFNLGLHTLNLRDNSIVSLQLNELINLESVDVSNNFLSTLNVANGNNEILTQFNALNNPDLECVSVDNETQANNGNGVYTNWLVDPIVLFSENCSICSSSSVTVITQNITVNLNASGVATTTPQNIDNGSVDSCGETPLLSLDISSFDCGNIGENTVQLTGTDINGNSSVANAIVTVVDTLTPIVVGQDITVDLEGQVSISITAMDVDAGSTDNCDITLSLDIDTFFETGVFQVELEGIDSIGNTNTETVLITVTDSTLGVVENHEKLPLLIVPNPAKNYINVINAPDSVEFYIYDITGKLLITSELNMIDVSSLREGVYFIRLNKPSYSQVIMFLKE